jgi:hypothetical protein
MPNATHAAKLADFQCRLIGTWSNDDELRDSETSLPLSFNVMPLPQQDPQPHRPDHPHHHKYGGFILKNFTFTETIRFNGSAKPDDPAEHRDPAALAVIAGAPNRGGTYTQFAHAVFYDQQVQFAEGPQGPKPGKPIGDIVHVENGAWLHFDSIRQSLGPYEPDSHVRHVKGQVLPQPPYITVAKQIAVPHGNSVLALGSVDIYGEDEHHKPLTILPGRPVIADAFVPYPEPADITVAPQIDPYKTLLNDNDDYENPNVEWTWNANKPLQLALDIINPQSHIHWRVTTRPLFGGDGSVTNIPFEEKRSKVTEYWADYWLLSKDPFDAEDKTFDYLAYTQTILMEMIISRDGGKTYDLYVFPHVTSNTVRKLPGSPSDARRATEGLEGGGG